MKTNLTRIERLSRVVLAVLVGLLIWGAAINEQIFTVESDLPLSLRMPSEYILLGSSHDRVRVSYTGSGWDMLRFQLGDNPSVINREFQPAAGNKYPLSADISVSPSTPLSTTAVLVDDISPSQITIYVDTLISRRVPVTAVFSDGIPGRFRFIRIVPNLVTVSGPESLVSSIDSVRTDEIPAGLRSADVSLALPHDMVAYSSDSVKISVYDPVAPARNVFFR